MVSEKALEDPLDCKEIQPVHSERDQPWDFFGRNDAKAETPVLWLPHAACQASLFITNPQSLLKLKSIELVMPSNHLFLCHPLLLLPSVFPSIRVFSSESAIAIRWPKYRRFSFSISPSNEYLGLNSFRMDWLYLLSVKRLSRVFSNTTVQRYQFFSAQLSI